MQLVFVHGWGFGPDIWAPILERLDFRTKISCIDLGFFHKASAPDDWPDNAIAVGHSLGVMWLLKNAPLPPKALISISGFDRFVPHINPRTIEVMKKGIERNPQNQLQKFWTACNASDYAIEAEPNKQQLLAGLDQLMTWDMRSDLENLDCPVLSLAARDDQITPEKMLSSIWSKHKITWSETGGHALPLTKPGWTANQILEFIHE